MASLHQGWVQKFVHPRTKWIKDNVQKQNSSQFKKNLNFWLVKFKLSSAPWPRDTCKSTTPSYHCFSTTDQKRSKARIKMNPSSTEWVYLTYTGIYTLTSSSSSVCVCVIMAKANSYCVISIMMMNMDLNGGLSPAALRLFPALCFWRSSRERSSWCVCEIKMACVSWSRQDVCRAQRPWWPPRPQTHRAAPETARTRTSLRQNVNPEDH